MPDFLETLLYSSFRAFNSAMIAGLSLILDPHNERASDMRDIVQSFMAQHPHDPAADEFSQKEAAIVRHREYQSLMTRSLRCTSVLKKLRKSSLARRTASISSATFQTSAEHPYPPLAEPVGMQKKSRSDLGLARHSRSH